MDETTLLDKLITSFHIFSPRNLAQKYMEHWDIKNPYEKEEFIQANLAWKNSFILQDDRIVNYIHLMKDENDIKKCLLKAWQTDWNYYLLNIQKRGIIRN